MEMEKLKRNVSTTTEIQRRKIRNIAMQTCEWQQRELALAVLTALERIEKLEQRLKA